MKHNIKRILCMLLVLTMAFSMSMPAFAADHAHVYDGVITTEPSCTRNGERTLTCTVEGCGHVTTEPVSATGHHFVNGVCACGESKIPAHQHNYVEEIITPATCTVDGEKKFTCSVEGCDRPVYTDKILAPGHKYDENGVCTVEGCGYTKPVGCDGSAECPAADDAHDFNCLKALSLRSAQDAAAEMERANQIAVQKVQALMDAIPDVPADFDGVNYPEFLREPTEAYQALSPELQAQIDNSRLMAWYAPVVLSECTGCGLSDGAHKHTCPVEYSAYIGTADSGIGYTTLAAAVSAAQSGNTITLLKDITVEASGDNNYALLIDKALNIDGNSKKVTLNKNGEDDLRVININTDDTVNFKNLTIDTAGAERGINIIDLPATVTLNDVNIYSGNYAVMIATSAASTTGNVTTGTTLSINKGNFTGLNVINIAAPSSNVTIQSAHLTTNDDSYDEDYATVALFSTASNCTINISDCTMKYSGKNDGDSSLVGDSSSGSTVTATNNIFPEDSLVKEIGPKFFEAMIGDASYSTLVGANADAKKTGATVKLLRDITLTEESTELGNAVINLNGKTLIGQVYGIVEVAGGHYLPQANLPLIGKSNSMFISENAVFNIVSDSELSVTAGDITLAASWRTLPGQKVTVNCNSFTIPAGINLDIRGNVEVAGSCNLSMSGTVMLGSNTPTHDELPYTAQDYINATMSATLKVPAKLNDTAVKSGIPGFEVIFDKSTSTYRLYAEAFIDGTDANNNPLSTYYPTLAEAIAAAQTGSKTVKLLRDITLTAPAVLGSAKLDLNGKTLQGDILGTMLTNGGSYKTSNGTILLSSANAKFISTDAVINIISLDKLSVESGSITLGDSWRTLPEQEITVKSGASFTVPSGKTFEILGKAVVEGALVAQGSIVLGRETSDTPDVSNEAIKEASLGATLTTTASVNVASGIAGYTVAKDGNTYKLTEGEAKIGNTTYATLAAALSAATANDTVTMLSDATLNGELAINCAKKIDTNGNTLTFADDASIELASGASLTITGMTDAQDEAMITALRQKFPSLCISKGSVVIQAHSLSSSCGSTVTCSTCNQSVANTSPASHTLTYSASGNVITETCSKNCGHRATATIDFKDAKKTEATYTGSPITDMLEVSYSVAQNNLNAWQGGTLAISYLNADNKATNADPGAATGKISIGGATASKSFRINLAKLDSWEHSDFYRDSGKSLSFTIETNGNYAPGFVSGVKIYNSADKLVATVPQSSLYAKLDKNNDVVIIVPASVMSRLSVGRYTMVAELLNFTYDKNDGDTLILTATTEEEFRVRYPRIIPSTGDSANFLLWGGLLVGASAAMGGCFFLLKKKGKK